MVVKIWAFERNVGYTCKSTYAEGMSLTVARDRMSLGWVLSKSVSDQSMDQSMLQW